ncbi:MAG: hypothetical protein ACOH16_02155 [Propionibacteriaceae bacterium]
MFAVAGTWTMDLAMVERQADALVPLVTRVPQNPGFVKGYWSQDVDDPAVNLTFVVFETFDQAVAFRNAVLANSPAQTESGVQRAGLRIVEITAEA